MISYVKIKPTADKAKNWVKGVCTSDDTKPVEGIANGSKLLELDTGKRCVYDEGQTKWIEYGTGEDRSNKPKNVKTEVYEGLLSELLTFENIQKYGAALDAGGIGVAQSLSTQDEQMAKVKMGIVYHAPSEMDGGVFFFGAGTFGSTFRETIDMAINNWNRVFSDQAEYENYWEQQFALDSGVSVIAFLSTSSVSHYFAYISIGDTPRIIYGSHIDKMMGRFRFTFYHMDEGVEPSGGAKVTTETISGPLSTIFNDNGWDEAKFTQLIEDIRTRRASARVSITMGDDFFDAQLMVLGSNSPSWSVLATAFFMTRPDDPCLRILWTTLEGEGEEFRIVASMLLFSPNTKTWIDADDNTLSQMTGQSSYDLIITRIEEE